MATETSSSSDFESELPARDCRSTFSIHDVHLAVASGVCEPAERDEAKSSASSGENGDSSNDGNGDSSNQSQQNTQVSTCTTIHPRALSLCCYDARAIETTMDLCVFMIMATCM